MRESAGPSADPAEVQSLAAAGIASASQPLPHAELIQASFGRHDIAGIRAATGGAAADASTAIGARAYATGDRVAFAEAPDLHTAAHEAAHVVQQRAGVHLAGGVGQSGDAYEQHADRVADIVVDGGNAEAVLDEMAGGCVRSAVQRSDVDTPSVEEAPVDEAGASAEGGPAFRPTILKPDSADVKMYERYAMPFSVENAADAPQGTSFSWKVTAHEPGDALEHFAHDEIDGGAGVNVVVHGVRPAVGAVVARVEASVPEQEPVTSPFEVALAFVLDPEVDLVELHSFSVPSDAGACRLHVGDTFKARVAVSNIYGVLAPTPSVSLSEGPLASTNVAVVSATADEKVVDVSMRALSVSSDVESRVDLDFGGGSLDCDLALPIDGVDMARQDFINGCSQATTLVVGAYAHAIAVLEILAAAYFYGHESHTAVLKAQGAWQNIPQDLLMDVAMAFLPGGVGGGVGGWMKTATTSNFMADAVKDMAKAGTKGLQNQLPRGAAAELKPLSTEPTLYRSGCISRLNLEKEAVADIIMSWQQRVNTNDPSFYLDFDPVTMTTESLMYDGTPLKEMPIPELEATRDQMELGFWKEWLTQFGFTMVFRDPNAPVDGMPIGAPRAGVQKNQGWIIRQRIDQLGRDGAAFLEMYGGIARDRATREADEFNDNVREGSSIF